jgi:hypothetical protein
MMQVNQVDTDQQYDDVVEKCRGIFLKKTKGSNIKNIGTLTNHLCCFTFDCFQVLCSAFCIKRIFSNIENAHYQRLFDAD